MTRHYLLITALLILVAIFVGCESTSNYEACLNDQQCAQEIYQLENNITQASTTALASTPQTAPLALTIGGGIGGVVALLVALSKGKKIRKDK